MIQIHDSKKKGEYFVRLVAKNGKILSNSETLTSTANVGRNIVAQDSCFGTYSGLMKVDGFMFWAVNNNRITDHTAEGYWAKKYGCKKGKPKTK